MKMKFLLAATAVAMTVLSTYSADVLTPTSLFKGGKLTTVAFCKVGNDFVVDEKSDNAGNSTFIVYDKNLKKVFDVSDRVESIQYLSSSDNMHYEYTEFSQTLLNDDDNIEYIVSHGHTDNGWFQYTGLSLMQSNGKELASISLSSGISSVSLDAVKVGDRVFLCVRGGGISTVYEVNRKAQANVLTLVSESADAVGFPNPVSQGEVFTIEGLKESEGATVVVNRLDGGLVKAFEITEEPTISTGDLSVGTYIYTVTHNGNLLTSGKLIVK